ncbi:MAG: hypothetical protein HYV07_15490 [Deltaproteobacteria bacterium]|nr:hypothetical protein [Deltaproteobacteria bacterium]
MSAPSFSWPFNPGLVIIAALGCGPSTFVATPSLEGGLVIAASQSPNGARTVRIVHPDARSFELDDGSGLAVFSFAPDTFVGPSGATIDPRTAGVSFADLPLPRGSCGECQLPLPEGPQLVFPGDRCAPPEWALAKYGHVFGDELLESEAALALARSVRIEWPGSCQCEASPHAENIELQPIFPATDPATVLGFALAPNGTLAIRTPTEVILAAPNGERAAFPIGEMSESNPVWVRSSTPTAFAFTDLGQLLRVSLGEAPTRLSDAVEASFLAARGDQIMVADFTTGPTYPEIRFFACDAGGSGCKLERSPAECRTGRPAGLDTTPEGYAMVSSAGRVLRRGPAGEWICGASLSQPGDPLPFSVVRALSSDTLAVTCGDGAEGTFVRAFDLTSDPPELVSELVVSGGHCPYSPFFDGESIVTPIGFFGSGVVYSPETRTLSLADLMMRRGHPFRRLAVAGNYEAAESPDSTIRRTEGSEETLVYGNPISASPDTPLVVARDEDFLAIDPSGVELLPERGSEVLEGLGGGERIERLSYGGQEAWVLTRREEILSLRKLDPGGWALGPPHPVSLEDIDAIGALGRGWVLVLSGGFVFAHSECHGLDEPAIAGQGLLTLSTASGVAWAGGPGTLVRIVVLGQRPLAQLITLGPDELDGSIQTTGPMTVFAASALCAGHARVAVNQPGIRLSIASNHWNTQHAIGAVGEAPNPCGDAGPIAMCPETDKIFSGLGRPLVLTPSLVIREAGQMGVESEARRTHSMPPVLGAATLHGGAEILTVGPFGRLARLRLE